MKLSQIEKERRIIELLRAMDERSQNEILEDAEWKAGKYPKRVPTKLRLVSHNLGLKNAGLALGIGNYVCLSACVGGPK